MSGYGVVELVFLRTFANCQSLIKVAKIHVKKARPFCMRRYCSIAKISLKRSPRRAHLSHQIKAKKKDKILTINDVKVDPKARFGNITSPISQDHALDCTLSNPLATGEADRAATGCPAVLTPIYLQLSKDQE